MQGNVRLHTVHLWENFLEARTIQRKEWITYSSDLNPIERVWNKPERRVVIRPRPSVTWRTGRSDFHQK
ncbi:hypothetical protein TNCV_4455621 [Trichonephila clavipes]|nr:hypothetical protein TNCV_4455621 [Trichonephila clavipes]